MLVHDSQTIQSPLQSVRKSFLSPINDTPMGRLGKSIETSKKRMTALRNFKELTHSVGSPGNMSEAKTVFPGMGAINDESLRKSSIYSTKFVRPSDKVTFKQSSNDIS